ncbi:MAG: hypothetical protein Q9184_007817, partial [Pyrenodesmia sp. 2 TL-2023]
EGASLETTIHETDEASARTTEDTALQRGIGVAQGLHIEGAVDQKVPTMEAPGKGTTLRTADHRSDATAASQQIHISPPTQKLREASPTASPASQYLTLSPPSSTQPTTIARPPQKSHHSPPPTKRSSRPLPSQQAAFTSTSTSTNPPNTTSLTAPSPAPQEKLKPNYAPTGLLAAETNTVAHTSIILKYHEPPSARLPPASTPHLLYIFKSSALLSTLALHERSCWLFGREKMVADVPIEHPSCSKQHAVLQFRFVVRKDEWGEERGSVGLYVLDLDSANGTWVNGERVEGRRYVEVRSKDVLRFGESTREYVILVPPKDKGK